MVGVFVAFIRVVYGRMIYMSLPFSICSTLHCRVLHFIKRYCSRLERHIKVSAVVYAVHNKDSQLTTVLEFGLVKTRQHFEM